MVRKDLLTIGKLAELSGVHVKALRYYDRIGILPPTYVNEENGYRYYSQEHVLLVEIIKLCAELSIPLKELKEYIEVDGSIENIAELADVGIRKIKQQMKRFQDNLSFLEEVKKDIQRSSAMKEGIGETIIDLGTTDYWMEPYTGHIGDIEYHRLMSKLFEKIEVQLGLKTKYEMGTALIFENGHYETYMFVTLENEDKNSTFDNFVRIQKSSYRSTLTKEKNIASASKIFPDLFALDYKKIVFELELISVQMNCPAPKFEIRCSLPIAN